MKITILDGAVENPGDLSWEALAALGDLTVYDYTAPEEILPRIGDAPIILTNKTPITRQTMDECPNLRYIGVLATGFNVIDVAAAKEKGIVVANVPSYGTQAVAQFVMAQLLEICHRIGHHNDAVQQGRWTACRDFSFWDYPLMELAGKTLKYYIEQAGGYGFRAKKSKAYIVYMNGQVKRAKKGSRELIQPGCEVIVPVKEKSNWSLQNTLSIATTSASLATMIASIANILK